VRTNDVNLNGQLTQRCLLHVV